MPSRNIYKQDVPETFYHVYFRGGNRSRIFRDAADSEKMLRLFARYLSLEEVKNSAGISFPNYYNKLELVAFCLMPNHVHLLIYQRQQKAMAEFMRSLLTSYSMYFNKKYKRSGPLFESRYKASMILDDSYLQHITRYIHLNPRQWRDYEYSSLPYYLHQVTDEWIEPKRILELFSSPEEYLAFMEDYEENKEMMGILKHELATEMMSKM
ncbi:MAG: transposase [Candidatus Saccharibacteria bacterium]